MISSPSRSASIGMFLWCLGGFFLTFPLQALASPLPVAIDPTRFEFTASRGEQLSGTLEFWNGSDMGLPIEMETADFTPQDEEGHVTVGGEEDSANSLKTWITPVYPELTVYPKQNI